MKLNLHSSQQFYAVLTLASLVFSHSLHSDTTSQHCSGFQGTTSKAALAYLNQERSTLEPACIDDALTILEQNRPKEAVQTLLRYLDFKKPTPPGVPHTPRIGPTNGAFPAAEVLADYGDLVVPDLRRAITNDDVAIATRVNAAEVYFWISNEPSTIAFIAQAGRDAVDSPAGKDLKRLAETMVRYCPTEIRDACLKGLTGR